MKDLVAVAHEWHNYDTGHCYVDYIAHPGQDRADGYTMKPLYYLPSELLKQRDELLEAIVAMKAALSHINKRLDDMLNHPLLKHYKAAITKAEER